MHLDEEQIQRLLHAELAPAPEASARDHLAMCAECRSRLSAAERDETWVLDQLRRLDHPPPRVHVAAITASRRARGVRWGRWAAGILVALGVAGAAYAAPGSPVRQLVHRVTSWIAGTSARPTSRTPPPTADSVAQGIAVTPGNRFTIVFSTEQPDVEATVLLTDGADVVVRAIGGQATFTSDLDRLTVDNSGPSARFQIEIPRRAPHVEIRIDAHRVFSKQGSRVLTDGRRELEGRYLVPLFRSPR